MLGRGPSPTEQRIQTPEGERPKDSAMGLVLASDKVSSRPLAQLTQPPYSADVQWMVLIPPLFTVDS